MQFRSNSTSTDAFGSDIKTPKLKVKWFYAADIPNSKPDWYEYTKSKEPEKFIPFSNYDSFRLEKCYQSITDDSIDQTVQVSEDRLFQVNLKNFELSPVYWEGPVYEVRRGCWFDSNGLPLSHSLTQIIEGGYQAKKPYLYGDDIKDTKSKLLSKISKETVNKFNKSVKDKNKHQLKEAQKEIEEKADEELKLKDQSLKDIQSKHLDLLDLENGKTVLYCDERNAVMFPSSMNSDFELDVIRNFGASSISLMSVEKISRGYTEEMGKTIFDNLPSNPLPDLSEIFHDEFNDSFNPNQKTDDKDKKLADREKQTNDLNNLMDLENAESTSNRQIDHLILCIHGIGQVLGHKYESVNFTHSINVLRSTMNNVYLHDDRYQKLAYPDDDVNEMKEKGELKPQFKNNKIQVLPISWRHKIDFHPTRKLQSYDENGNHRLPSLSEINVDGVKPLRNILGDVVLDVLLYYEPKYVNQVFDAVIKELNRVYKLYKEKNPNFNGKIHIMGHSLGSAISFDILSKHFEKEKPNTLSFEVENLFCVGSPVGVFKLLEQTNIKAKQLINEKDPNSKFCVSPECKNLYNIFHPCDPVGYRMEPLVSPRFANLRPEEVPFAMKGFNTQIKGLASLGDELSEKFIKATSWFNKSKTKEEAKDIEVPKTTEELASEENALGDIIKNITKSSENQDPDDIIKKKSLSEKDLQDLTALNRSGRIDYSLPMGVFDISLVSAISAHVSYFEDQDTAGFIMKEVLASDRSPVERKTAQVYK
ncbi:DDHD-domain-containing protein [Hyphopichia burtonii NRRL Y-1933]|uniref:DDHD-domain-containing protein n=1 Tax=Hyphopichia burtonii NRRL Y-1933 TaxID=984485 RepID=A0A1E4RI65_9ASCO|nr:DDHD-domain-containing protein [Hyphopichia burtonii NRRL Y-1933]ODV66968.1 DDHD-domain-containing protein [Hyphopichia burtonii NRRL Y-1933]